MGAVSALALGGVALAGSLPATGAASPAVVAAPATASTDAPVVAVAAAKKTKKVTTIKKCKTGKNGKKTCKTITRGKPPVTSPRPTTSTPDPTTSTPTPTTTTPIPTTSTPQPSTPLVNNTYAVTREAAFNSREHVVFRPSDPAAVGRPMPVLAFGNGACAHNNGSEVIGLLSAIAAKGIVIVDTANMSGSGTGNTDGSPIPAILTRAISWAETENNRAGSPLQGRLDLTRVATAGHSCGGLEALVAGADPRVKAVISLDSGLFADASFGYSRAELQKLHSPVMFMDGGSGDIAYDNTRANYDLVNHVPAVNVSNSFAGHTGFITGQQRGDAVTVVVQFLDAVLNGQSSAKSFIVDPSGLASRQGWSVRSKNW
ncbi:MAG: hypothetical protein U0Q15_01575 [Kineosporiaceae bacterium]